jgi:hypothetical protein
MLCVVAFMVGVGWNWGAGVVRAQKNQNPMQNQDPMAHQNDDPLQPSTVVPGSMPSADSDMPRDPVRVRMKEDSAKMLNDSRHKRLEDDVDKMMSLMAELKTDVDKSNKDELSLKVMRKAAEIEKLAHDVQNRMKN